jgi:signal transduction histidine kinase
MTLSCTARSLPGGIAVASFSGLRGTLTRFFLIQLMLVSLAVVGGTLATNYVIQQVVTRQALREEAAYFWAQRARDPSWHLPDTKNLTGYLAGPDLPDALQRLPPGFSELELDDRRPLVFVSDDPRGRLVLVFEAQQVSGLAFYFGVVPGVLVLLALYGLLLFSYRITSRAVSPIVRLAEQLEDHDFSREHHLRLDLGGVPEDSEVAILVDALDRFGERVESFIERERNFTRDAGHELRTPLAVIKGTLDLLDQKPGPTALERKALDRLRRTADGMESMLETLLLLAREEEIRPALQPVSVNLIAREQIEDLESRATERGNRIDLEEDAEIMLMAPPRVLAIVLNNLLRNAVNYTEAGTVTVRVDSDGMRVRDTGIGMSAGEIDKAFKPFFRGEEARNSRRPGHGLGLSIVKRLCDQMNWSVTVTSEQAVGTEVRVRFAAGQSRSEMRNPRPGTVSMS